MNDASGFENDLFLSYAYLDNKPGTEMYDIGIVSAIPPADWLRLKEE